MATSSQIIEFTAPDGNVVYYEPYGLWKVWNANEVYMGGSGLNKWVAKVRDHVYNELTGKTQVVVSLSNYVPSFDDLPGTAGGGDSVLSSGVGADPSTWRFIFNSTLRPYVGRVDGRLYFPAENLSHGVLFRGTDTSRTTGRVLSRRFNSNGEYIDDMIPAIPMDGVQNPQNAGFYIIPPFNLVDELIEGEAVTLVVYDVDTIERFRQRMWVNKSNWTARIEDSSKVVTHLGLESDFLSPTIPNTLEIPQGVTVDAVNMRGLVYYRDGSVVPVNIDHDRFMVMGLEGFYAGEVGFNQNIPLRYKLAAGEQSENLSTSGEHVTQEFRAVVVPEKGAYSSKLVGFPNWRSDLGEYQMRWYLTNMDRNFYMDVTAWVLYNSNSDVFEPVGYGRVQRLSVRLNLRDVSGTLPSFIHNAQIVVVLGGPGTNVGVNWRVGFSPTQNPMYGEGLYASTKMVNQNLWRLNVRGSHTTFDSWLKAAFYDTLPIYDARSETKAPTPTHMRIFSPAGASTIVEIAEWQREFSVSVNFTGRSNVQIGFLQEVNGVMLELGIACMPVKIVA